MLECQAFHISLRFCAYRLLPIQLPMDLTMDIEIRKAADEGGDQEQAA